jgi:hypothetical protein
MKRLRDLTAADLERVSVWHYDGATDDVAHVRATDRSELSETDAEMFIARTQFVLASGAQHLGFCSPAIDCGLDVTQPVILTSVGPVYVLSLSGGEAPVACGGKRHAACRN